MLENVVEAGILTKENVRNVMKIVKNVQDIKNVMFAKKVKRCLKENVLKNANL